MLFQFADAASAANASGVLRDLGYEPVVHQGGQVHIHLHGSDLTSALEIVQASGGTMVVHSSIEEAGGNMVLDEAYGMDAIPIPAHIVNEDWIAQEDALHNRDDDASNAEDCLPDGGTYSYFSGDVHT
nr:hypothetical protein [Paenibacillus oenotherae]